MQTLAETVRQLADGTLEVVQAIVGGGHAAHGSVKRTIAVKVYVTTATDHSFEIDNIHNKYNKNRTKTHEPLNMKSQAIISNLWPPSNLFERSHGWYPFFARLKPKPAS